jgi:putative transposase
MPRTARAIEAGLIYHVLNRGNGRQMLFRKPEDFDAFERILAEGLSRYPVDLLTWCLMGNHWHLVLRPRTDEALADLMRWVGVTHVRRHHAHYHTTGGGHLYQGRYKSFPVQDDRHFLTLARYVEANALRAELVRRAELWRWCALAQRGQRRDDAILRPHEWPVDRPRNWTALVNEPLLPREVEQVRTSIVRDRPLGSDNWVRATAKRLGLEWTLRPRGRPKKRPAVGKE